MRPGGGGRGAGKSVFALRFETDGRWLDGIENLVEAREFLRDRFALGQRDDGAHVSEKIVAVVKGADVGRQHLANAGGLAAGVVREGVFGAVEIEPELAEERPFRVIHGTHHLVVDGAFFFEAELVVGGIFGDAEIAHFAANFFVGVIGVQRASSSSWNSL